MSQQINEADGAKVEDRDESYGCSELNSRMIIELPPVFQLASDPMP